MRLCTLPALSLFLVTGTATADPLLDWSRARLARADQPGGGGAAAPAPTAPLLADVSGPAKSVSLADILQLTIRQAPALAQAKIDIEVAEAQIAQAQAWSEWAIRARAEGSTAYSSQSKAREDNVNLSASLARPLATGGTIGVSADGTWRRGRSFDPGDLLGITSTYSESVTATLTQPLLAGRGAALVHAAERTAATQRDASKVASRGAAIDAVRQVVLAYLDLVAAERDLEIRRASLGLAQERQRVTQAGIRGGGVARAELIPVDQAIATREEDVLAGELAVLDQSLTLRQLVQLPVARGDMLLASTGDLAIPARSWQQDALIEQALLTSPELARFAALEAGATIQVEVNENGILPSLDLQLSFGPSGSADGPLTAAKEMVTFDQYAASGALEYNSTWGRGAARAVARGQRARRESIRVSMIDVRSQIVAAVARAVAQVQVAERRYVIAARAVELAEQNLQVEKDRLSLGKSRNVEVLIRQDELRAAQLRSVRAVIDWHRAATAIAGLTGEILPQYGIELR